MNELSTTSILALFETTKEERQLFIGSVLEAIDAGDVDALNIHLQVKGCEKLIEELKNNRFYKAAILEAAEKYGANKFEFRGAEISINEVGVQYDYTNCMDPELMELEVSANTAKESLKARQKFLQTVPIKGMDIRVKDELVTVYPPAKSSTTTPVITLK